MADLELAVRQISALLAKGPNEYGELANLSQLVSGQIDTVDAKIIALMKVRQGLVQLQERLDTGDLWRTSTVLSFQSSQLIDATQA